jgi:hypothetical protein
MVAGASPLQEVRLELEPWFGAGRAKWPKQPGCSASRPNDRIHVGI